jgi:ERCC4-type nuclease
MVLIVDYRESKLIDALNSINATHITQNLLLGDASLYIDPPEGTSLPFVDSHEHIPEIIIERKTVPDMIASIKDGRYMEQKARLHASSIPNHNILFIIEGSRTGVANIHSTVFSLFYHSGFGVLFSTSVNDTARIINSFERKLNKDPQKTSYYLNSQTPQTPQTYAAFLKPEKKANICKENTWIIMLQQLPYVSSSIATALMEKYINIPLLIDAIKEDPNILDTFKINGNDGKPRKISSRAIKSITELLT